jgi:hypothetical protein
MRVRFQADADLDGRIIRGLRRIAPEIDIRTAADAKLDGLKDPEVLRTAADSGRVLVTQDRRTMRIALRSIFYWSSKFWRHPAARGDSNCNRDRRTCFDLERQQC